MYGDSQFPSNNIEKHLANEYQLFSNFFVQILTLNS